MIGMISCRVGECMSFSSLILKLSVKVMIVFC